MRLNESTVNKSFKEYIFPCYYEICVFHDEERGAKELEN